MEGAQEVKVLVVDDNIPLLNETVSAIPSTNTGYDRPGTSEIPP